MGSQILFYTGFECSLISGLPISLSLCCWYFCEYSQMDNQPGLRIHANIRPEQPARISFKAVKVDFPSADIFILVYFLLSFFFLISLHILLSINRILFDIFHSESFNLVTHSIYERRGCRRLSVWVWVEFFHIILVAFFSFFSDSLSHVKFHFLFVMCCWGRLGVLLWPFTQQQWCRIYLIYMYI